jgi:hypothetical protein
MGWPLWLSETCLAALVLAIALRFESEIFFADLYAAEDVHPVAAVLALADALYFEFHFFFADLYAAEDCRPAAAALALAVALYFEFIIFLQTCTQQKMILLRRLP